MNRRAYGAQGERAAELYLIRAGALLLERNYRCPYGEIDLIVQMEGAIVFVEVKRRSSTAYGRPCEAVDARKQAHIGHSAQWYLKEKKRSDQRIRFDIVEITGEQIQHLRAAFYPPV